MASRVQKARLGQLKLNESESKLVNDGCTAAFPSSAHDLRRMVLNQTVTFDHVCMRCVLNSCASLHACQAFLLLAPCVRCLLGNSHGRTAELQQLVPGRVGDAFQNQAEQSAIHTAH